MPEVDAVLGTGALHCLVDVLQQLDNNGSIILIDRPGGLLEGNRLLTTPPGTAYIKLAEGCLITVLIALYLN